MMNYNNPIDKNEIYSAPFTVEGASLRDEIPLLSSSHTAIYDIYDALAEQYPTNITKTALSYAFGREMRKYSFKAEAENPTKVLIITSIHGYEQGCAWVTAQFFKLMFATNDEKLNFLRKNVSFEVIPVANPWGFDHNKRKNKNGVDLNRNFKPYFTGLTDKASDEYPGEYPESESEARAIVNLIEENPDAKVVLDYHNIAKGRPLFYVYGERDLKLANLLFTALTEKWRCEYPEFSQEEMLGTTRPNGKEGMLADHVISKGLWVLTMETPWCMPLIGKEKYDAPTIRCALDLLVNTLLVICK